MSYARKLHFPPLELKGPVSRARIWYEFHLAHIKQIWLAQQLFSQGFNPLCKVPGRADGALRVLRGDQTRASFNNTGTDTPVNGKRQSKENLIFFFMDQSLYFRLLGRAFQTPVCWKGNKPFNMESLLRYIFLVSFILGLFLAFGHGRLRLQRHLWLQCIYT